MKIDVHNSNLQSDMIQSIASTRDSFYPLSFTYHDPLYTDSLNQFVPPTSSSESLDFLFFSLNCDHVQGGHIPQVKE